MDQMRYSRLVNDYKNLSKLAEASPLFSFRALRGDPPERYLFDLDCITLVKGEQGDVERIRGCLVQVYLPSGYPRRKSPIAHVLHPDRIWHPNIVFDGPQKGGICAGDLIAGQFLDAYVYHLYHILSFVDFTMDESQSLNSDAAAWARRVLEDGWFPTDTRSLVPGKEKGA